MKKFGLLLLSSLLFRKEGKGKLLDRRPGDLIINYKDREGVFLMYMSEGRYLRAVTPV